MDIPDTEVATRVERSPRHGSGDACHIVPLQSVASARIIDIHHLFSRAGGGPCAASHGPWVQARQGEAGTETGSSQRVAARATFARDASGRVPRKVARRGVQNSKKVGRESSTFVVSSAR